jgi:uncharacterized membrane-anchored protein
VKNLRLLIFLVVALLQLSVPAFAVWKREQTLRQGRVWKFKTAPVDPEDAVRGRYIALSFAIEEFPQSERVAWKPQVYVALKEDPNGFAQIEGLSDTPLTGDNVIRAETRGWYEGKQMLTFPFRTYWVSEKLAPEAETAYRANSRRGKENAFVTVRVREGDAALEQLYLENQPLGDYLRGQRSNK